MLTISGRRVLNRSLQSLIKHNESTVTVLERLVEDLHEHPLLVPYQMINHERFEDLVWGIIKIMDSKNLHSPRFDLISFYSVDVLPFYHDSLGLYFPLQNKYINLKRYQRF